MSSYCENEGAALYNLFLSLGINTGKTGLNDINAWYDSGCQETLDFLNWFTENISKENVLSGLEEEGFQILQENNLVLNDEEYEDAIEEAELRYPDVFDLEINRFEVDCLKDEFVMYEDDVKRLDQMLVMNGQVTEKLKERLSKATQKNMVRKVKLDKAEEDCLRLSNTLDEINKKLEAQIHIYGDKLIYFNSTENQPSFISNMPIEKRDCYHSDIKSDINDLIKNNFKLLPNLQVALQSHSKKLEQSLVNTSTELTDALEEMRNRILNSTLNSIFSKAKLSGLEAYLKYLNKLDVFEVCTLNRSVNLEKDHTQILKDQLQTISADIEMKAAETVNIYINLPKLYMVQNEIKTSMEKLCYFTEINSRFEDILSYQCLVMLMYDKENSNIKTTDKFFRDVYQYITYDLLNCQVRTNVMADVIKDYNNYKLKPFEQKYKVIQDIARTITETEDSFTLQDAVRIVNNFKTEQKTLEKKVFVEDFKQFKNDCQFTENNIKVLKKFLQSGPSTELVAFPYKLYEMFVEVDKILNSQDNAIKSYMLIPTETEKKLKKDQRFLLRRQLWMYFITTPQKIVEIIEQKEAEQRLNTA